MRRKHVILINIRSSDKKDFRAKPNVKSKSRKEAMTTHRYKSHASLPIQLTFLLFSFLLEYNSQIYKELIQRNHVFVTSWMTVAGKQKTRTRRSAAARFIINIFVTVLQRGLFRFAFLFEMTDVRRGSYLMLRWRWITIITRKISNRSDKKNDHVENNADPFVVSRNNVLKNQVENIVVGQTIGIDIDEVTRCFVVKTLRLIGVVHCRVNLKRSCVLIIWEFLFDQDNFYSFPTGQILWFSLNRRQKATINHLRSSSKDNEDEKERNDVRLVRVGEKKRSSLLSLLSSLSKLFFLYCGGVVID